MISGPASRSGLFALVKACTTLLLVINSMVLVAQRTTVQGSITDQESGLPVPYANVVFKGSNIGTITDTLGKFTITGNGPYDTLQVSSLGYETRRIGIRAGEEQQLQVELIPTAFQLGMIDVTPGEDPVYEVLRNIIANKAKNRPESIDGFEHRTYHKVRFDLNNFSDRIRKNLLLKNFDYLWENIDSTEQGVKYLPLLLTESSERYYHRKDPPASRTVVEGRRSYKFFKAQRIMAFVQDLYIDPPIYQEHMIILDKSFPSPLNDNYNRYHKFRLDTALHQVDGATCQRIFFRPKNRADLAFFGEMMIDTSSYAVVRIDLEFSVASNINFVRNYWLRQEFSKVDGGHRLLTRSQVLGDFTLVENSAEMTGFFGRKTTEISDVVIGEPKADGFYAGDKITYRDSAFTRPDTFWQQARTEPFTEEERNVVEMTERMKNDPRWKRTETVLHLLADGWLTVGKVDLGNVFTFYSWNPLEGPRAKFGMRTNDAFSRLVNLGGYGAYGFDDERFKGGGHLQFTFRDNKKNKTIIRGSYRDDLYQLGRSENMLPLDHVLTSAVRVSGAQRRVNERSVDLMLKRRWTSSVAVSAGSFQQRYSSLGEQFLERNGEILTPMDWYTTGGLQVGMHYGGTDEDDQPHEEMVTAISKKERPLISLTTTLGIEGLWEGQLNYQRIDLSFKHPFRLAPWGYLRTLVGVGMINGDLPFAFLHVPNGNPLVFNDNEAFNLMNYMEFASDRYGVLMLEQHFDGYLLNRIPLLRKLKLRSFIFGKAYYGSLTASNRQGSYALAEGMQEVRDPYGEIGFGIENILKIARIDFTWRLNYLDTPNTLPFIVKPSFYLSF